MQFGQKRLAITGGPGEGKSTVLGYISELGLPTLSADRVARDLWSKDSVQKQIGELLSVVGPVTPEVGRVAISSQPDFRRSLNRIMHPLILDAMLGDPAQIIEVPLLLETCLQPLFQRIWVVTCGEEEQLRRLVSRLGERDAALALIKTQLPTNTKCTFADRIIRTNRDDASVRAYVLDSLTRDFG